MTTITSLPDEIIDIILKNKNISIADVVNFMSTCKKFYNSTQSKKLWETKFYQRSWSANNKYNNNYNIKKRNKIFEHVDFEKEIKAGIKCINELWYYYSLMCNNNLSKSKVMELNHLLCSTATKPMIYYFAIDDLYRKLSQLSGHPDLTSTYHLGIIFRCLKQHRFAYKLKKFDSKPIQKQLLEKLLVIIAQYFQPHVSYSSIRTWLDDIALEVLIRLRKKYPMHSIFLISLEQFYFWRDNNIHDNFCDETEAKQIMHELEEFIFVELENHKLHQFWKILNLENKYVSENVQKYVLIITYDIVVRRLGICCNLVSYYKPNHEISLRILWTPKYHVENDLLHTERKFQIVKDLDNFEYLFLNEKSHLLYPLNIVKGKLRDNERELIYISRELMSYIGWTITWNELIKNTTSKIIKLFYRQQMRKKKFPDCSWEYNIILDIMMSIDRKPDVANFVMKISDASLPGDSLPRSPQKRRRSKEQNDKFAVGMIVTHSSHTTVRDEQFNPYFEFCSRQNYISNEYRLTNNHDGVIVGWDYSHQYFFSNYPYLRKNADNEMCQCKCNLYNGTNALHYLILSENNVICYVSEDNMSICPPKEINNMEIGRFFSKFEGTHYVPTKWLAEAYPEDTAALSKILLNQ